MPESRKFPPDGYQVTVLRKADILKCIQDNITDPEVVLDIVRRCEIDAKNFLEHGRWAGIPFLGNIRIPKVVQKFISDDTRQLMADAKETLEADKYLLFRREYATDVVKQEKYERYYKYELSKFVGRNLKFFRKVSSKRGDAYTRMLCFTLRRMTIVTEFNV